VFWFDDGWNDCCNDYRTATVLSYLMMINSKGVLMATSEETLLNRFGFVQRELDRIAVALREAPDPERYTQLYAAQQALSWALEPTAIAAPCDLIMGTREAPVDYLDVIRPASF
jgi:ABC-type transport system substrate-binding protein